MLWGLFLLLLGPGCGTVMSTFSPHEGGPEIYGGVRLDIGMEWYADVPFSVVADTLLLPVTIVCEITGDGGDEEGSASCD